MFARQSSTRNSLIVGLLAIAAFIGIGLSAASQEAPAPIAETQAHGLS